MVIDYLKKLKQHVICNISRSDNTRQQVKTEEYRRSSIKTDSVKLKMHLADPLKKITIKQ